MICSLFAVISLLSADNPQYNTALKRQAIFIAKFVFGRSIVSQYKRRLPHISAIFLIFCDYTLQSIVQVTADNPHFTASNMQIITTNHKIFGIFTLNPKATLTRAVKSLHLSVIIQEQEKRKQIAAGYTAEYHQNF